MHSKIIDSQSDNFYVRLGRNLFGFVHKHSQKSKFSPDEINNYFNSIFDQIFGLLDMNKASQSELVASLESSDYLTINEMQLALNFNNPVLKSTIITLIGMLNVLTERFSNLEIKFSLIGLLRYFYFLSYLISKPNWDTESQHLICSLKEYLLKVFELNYNITFDFYFIIRHKLFGFRKLIDECIFNKINNIQGFNRRDLDVLQLTKTNLKNVRSICLTLRIIDKLEQASEFFSEMISLFWYLFEEISFNEKLDVIFDIYNKHDITLNDNMLICMYENQAFNNEFTIAVNQLSAKNLEDHKVLYLLVIL